MTPGTYHVIKSMVLGGRQIWVSTSALSVVNCVTLDKSLKLPEPQPSRSAKYLPCRVERMRAETLMCAQCQVYSKGLINGNGYGTNVRQ